MLKKILCWMLCLVMMLSCVSALADVQGDMLSEEEVLTWVGNYLHLAEESTLLNNPHDEDALTEDGYAFVYDFGTFYYDTPDLTETSVLLGFVLLDGEYPGPRGTEVGVEAQLVMDAFRNQNEELVGNYHTAVLYFDGTNAGQVLRDGQRVQGVQYAVYGQEKAIGLTFTVEEGLVSAIRAWGLNGAYDAQLLADEVEEITQASNAVDYRRVPSSEDGSQLSVFGREDLSLNGMDLTTLTPEQAENVMGQVLEDVWMEDDEAGYLRTIGFVDCQMIFSYDKEKENPTLVMLEVSDDGMEGPRGVRVNDTLTSVLCRFRHGEGEFDGTAEVLYGAVDQASSGMAEYAMDGSAILRYAQTLEDGRTAMLIVTFQQLKASDILLTLAD